ncbi:hypothetical protein GRI69_09745 [Erythrobacter vulgaris]|uniref:NIPSNAP domain-containing protein n=1 Tax=Qipengyuania vulgaris TaxID=291985 RepID=A0A844XSE4_9SPHN|nr:hypothetical protein [Qipengyuania vulgaris]MXO48540.1 hypothetical protein [Qipengyuania vulgaris]
MIRFNSMIAAAALTVSLAAPAAAQEFPLEAGEYAQFNGIYVKDGGDFKYAEWLASEWKNFQEYALSQGWTTGYKIYYNVNPRDGEPTMYLMTSFASMPNAVEQERRNDAFDAWAKKTAEQQIAESGNRAEYRTAKSSILLQEYTPR